MYQISSKSDDFSWRCGDLTIFKIFLNFKGPGMGSFNSSCDSSYWSLIETIANCFVFEKIACLCRVLATDRQSDKQMDSIIA